MDSANVLPPNARHVMIGRLYSRAISYLWQIAQL